MNYSTYISSRLWRENPVRLKEFEAAGFQCRLCPNAKASGHTLEAHHRTYDRLGCEIDGDLTALCRQCHKGVTSMLRARRYAVMAPVYADISLADARDALVDPTRDGGKL
jgi:5-methylcytosine-specific restriction endonuclease McrA